MLGDSAYYYRASALGNYDYGDTPVFSRYRPHAISLSMARIARYVVPDLPHHVTRRGNRPDCVFFEEGDYALYRDWLGESCRRFGVEVSSL